jgi:exonuclease III
MWLALCRFFVASAITWPPPALAQLARKEAIYKAERFSDHAPVTVEYEWAL